MAALDKSESWHLEKAYAEKAPLHRPLPNRSPCPTEGQSELPGQNTPIFSGATPNTGSVPKPLAGDNPNQLPQSLRPRSLLATSRDVPAPDLAQPTHSFGNLHAGSALPHSSGAHRRAGAPGVLEASPRTPTSSPVLGAPERGTCLSKHLLVAPLPPAPCNQRVQLLILQLRRRQNRPRARPEPLRKWMKGGRQGPAVTPRPRPSLPPAPASCGSAPGPRGEPAASGATSQPRRDEAAGGGAQGSPGPSRPGGWEVWPRPQGAAEGEGVSGLRVRGGQGAPSPGSCEGEEAAPGRLWPRGQRTGSRGARGGRGAAGVEARLRAPGPASRAGGAPRGEPGRAGGGGRGRCSR